MKRIFSIFLILSLLGAVALGEWDCPKCGRSNDDAYAFCPACGSESVPPWVCPNCSNENEGNFNFCTFCGSAKPVEWVVGNTVTFGTYGGVAIEWEIMEEKPDGNYVLLSKYGLDAKPYNEEAAFVTWETCTLRAWLNGKFYQTAFTAEEKNRICLTDVVNADNAEYGTKGGSDTQDYVYLLSLDEVQKYYGAYLREVECYDCCEELICQPTAFAVSRGAYQFSQSEIGDYQSYLDYPLQAGAGWWWLRSTGSSFYHAASVYYVGAVITRDSSIDRDDLMVRPVVVVRSTSF